MNKKSYTLPTYEIELLKPYIFQLVNTTVQERFMTTISEAIFNRLAWEIQYSIITERFYISFKIEQWMTYEENGLQLMNILKSITDNPIIIRKEILKLYLLRAEENNN